MAFVSITRVKISKDLREAIVHISLLSDDPEVAQETIDALEAAKGYIKRILATRISLKRLPDPHFKLDTVTRDAYRLFGIMEGIKQEDDAAQEPPQSTEE